MSMFKRLLAVSALATTAAVAGLVAPASANPWVSFGPYPTYDDCLFVQMDFQGYTLQTCSFWDLTGTANDGWYFKVMSDY